MSMNIDQELTQRDNTAGARPAYVPKPKIGVRQPETYCMPQEFFIKRLINSPVEFGEAMVGVEVNTGEPGTKSYNVYQIDVAMHPHLGILICGFVGSHSHTSCRQALNRQIEILVRTRQILVDEIVRRLHFVDDSIPVGLFVAAPDIDSGELPRGEKLGIKLWTKSDDGPLYEAMMEAMESQCVVDERDDQLWQFLIAEVRSFSGVRGGYKSPLELLMAYE